MINLILICLFSFIAGNVLRIFVEKVIKNYRLLKSPKKRRRVRLKTIEPLFREIDRNRNKHPIKYAIRDTYYQITNFIEEIPLYIKRFIQRGKRGWANCDTWGLSNYLSEVIGESIRHLKRNIHGYPNGLTEGKWIDILNEIIYAFELAKRMNEGNLYYIKNKKARKKFQKILNEANKKYGSTDGCLTDKEKEDLERGFDLFRKHYFDLWD